MTRHLMVVNHHEGARTLTLWALMPRSLTQESISFPKCCICNPEICLEKKHSSNYPNSFLNNHVLRPVLKTLNDMHSLRVR